MNVIVFDFDDTLFPSSHINWSPSYDKSYPELAQNILGLITTAQKYCNKVYIITNAQKEWVELCTYKMLPGCEMLCDKVDVISTVDIGYSKDADYSVWKTNAFIDTLSKFFSNGGTLLSFGDCLYDRDAALAMKSDNVTVKNVKFASRPSLEQLLRQQQMVQNSFDYLFTHDGDLDLMLTISPTYNQTNPTTQSCSKEALHREGEESIKV